MPVFWWMRLDRVFLVGKTVSGVCFEVSVTLL